MGVEDKRVGVKNARSPGSIVNAEHHDASRSARGMDGVPATPKEFFNDTAEHALEDNAIVMVTNTTGSTAFVWFGQAGSAPGVPDATNAFALPAGSSKPFYAGSYDAKTSPAVKASAAGVQLAVISS